MRQTTFGKGNRKDMLRPVYLITQYCSENRGQALKIAKQAIITIHRKIGSQIRLVTYF